MYKHNNGKQLLSVLKRKVTSTNVVALVASKVLALAFGTHQIITTFQYRLMQKCRVEIVGEKVGNFLLYI